MFARSLKSYFAGAQCAPLHIIIPKIMFAYFWLTETTKTKLLTYEEIGSIIVNGKGAMLLIFMTERICLYGNL